MSPTSYQTAPPRDAESTIPYGSEHCLRAALGTILHAPATTIRYEAFGEAINPFSSGSWL
jgi:hypothetical protein